MRSSSPPWRDRCARSLRASWHPRRRAVDDLTDFRPQFTGFGPGVAHQALRSAAPLPEQQPVTIISVNANRILDLITDNGGSMSGDKLRLEVADLSPVD